MLLNKNILDPKNYKNYNNDYDFIKNLKLLFLIKRDNIKDIPRIVFKDYIFLYTNNMKDNNDFFEIDHSNKFVKFLDIFEKEETLIHLVFLLKNIFINKQLNTNYKTFLNKLSNEYIFMFKTNQNLLINIYEEKIILKDFDLFKISKKDFKKKEFENTIFGLKNLNINFNSFFKNTKNDYLFYLFLNIINTKENIDFIFNNLNIIKKKSKIEFLDEIITTIETINPNKTYDFILNNINIINKININKMKPFIKNIYEYNNNNIIYEKELFNNIKKILNNNDQIFKAIESKHNNKIKEKIINHNNELNYFTDI
jgi:hypothetical protein